MPDSLIPLCERQTEAVGKRLAAHGVDRIFSSSERAMLTTKPLSVLLDIPYPFIANHYDICHTGVTAIEFSEEDGYAIPKVLFWSSDSHLYKEGLLTKYNNMFYI